MHPLTYGHWKEWLCRRQRIGVLRGCGRWEEQEKRRWYWGPMCISWAGTSLVTRVLYTLLLLFWFRFSEEIFPLGNTSQPGTYYIEETGLQLKNLLPPWVMGREVCSTTSSSSITYKGVEERNLKNLPHEEEMDISGNRKARCLSLLHNVYTFKLSLLFP